jgi:hypothetical protein
MRKPRFTGPLSITPLPLHWRFLRLSVEAEPVVYAAQHLQIGVGILQMHQSRPEKHPWFLAIELDGVFVLTVVPDPLALEELHNNSMTPAKQF